jgi:glycosyltransferase involved in cell wall biosynthesis
VPVGELPRYYVAADCFTLPSHEEVWGLVLNEAAASALPLVTTTAVGAAPDLIEDGINGRAVAPGQPVELSRALREALDNAARWGEASRRIVRRATFDQNAEAILEALRHVKPSAEPAGNTAPRSPGGVR